MKKRAVKVYPQEFKKEAVCLVKEHGYSVKEASESVGIEKRLMYSWLKKYTSDDEILTKNEREELLELRKEVKLLRMEKEILKKASAFFAREMK